MPDWQESLRIFVAELDAEHRLLFELLSRVDVTCAAQTIEQLHDFLQIHFVHEQRLMDESGYPDREEHRLQHEHLAARVARFRTTIPPWSTAHVHQLRSLLSDWLKTHIALHDKALGLWLAASSETRNMPADVS